MQCPHPKAQQTWHEANQKVDDWMKDNDAHPKLRQAITKSLTAWHSKKALPAIQNPPETLDRAIR